MQVVIYLNEKERQEVDSLLDKLAAQGRDDLYYQKGSPSRSAMFKWLVKEKLEELEREHESTAS